MNLNNIHHLVSPKDLNYDNIFSLKSKSIFDDIIIEFLDKLSTEILKTKESKQYSDLITFAFWCRKSSILFFKSTYNLQNIQLGRGTVFHITPSNVPINFAYSLVVGLLSGNKNIVKISSKEFPQVTLLCSIISKVLQQDEFKDISNYIIVCRYDHDIEITSYFSINCDIRIIWGGDETINEIRKSPLSPRAFDITFADRHSLCIINADELIKEPNIDIVAKNFYNDTYLFDQNACTSPYLVIWLGTSNNIEIGKKVFWDKLHKLVKENYLLHDISAVDKYIETCRLAIDKDNCSNKQMPDNLIVRNSINTLFSDINKYKFNCGYFLEYSTKNINEIAEIINSKYQTLSYYGIKDIILKEFISSNKLPGIDRIVPIGRTTDFSLIWDGYDLINTLSRIINV